MYRSVDPRLETMDFSNLLKKEIDLKRKGTKGGLALKRKRLAEKQAAAAAASSPKASNNVESEKSEVQASGSSDQNQIVHLSSLEIELPKSPESGSLVSTDIARNDATTQMLDKDKALDLQEKETSNVQVKRTKLELKRITYDAYLAKENAVDIIIESQDILDENVNKLSLQIRKFIKEMLRTWSDNDDLQYPKALLLETKRDLVKLMYKLRSNKLDLDVVISLATIVHYIQTEQVIRANEAYLKLSIGNVAWPIGVRDVGIHARAADAKIAGDDKQKLANIMKSDSTRRWLVAVKRLINFSERLLQ